MPATDLVAIAREALLLAIVVAAPMVLAAAIVALLTGVLQAATQIPEAALGFAPRLLAVALALSITGPAIGSQLLDFTRRILELLPRVT